jgi:hypothetical protein
MKKQLRLLLVVFVTATGPPLLDVALKFATTSPGVPNTHDWLWIVWPEGAATEREIG